MSDLSLDELYHYYKVAFYDSLFGGMVYGAYIVVYAISVYIILRNPGFTSSRPRMFMFGVTTFMFALGISAQVLATTFGFKTTLLMLYPTFNQDPTFDRDFVFYHHAWATITCLMYILCDIICAWRTVVLWNKDKRVIGTLLLFILGTIAAAGFGLVVVFLSSFPEINNKNNSFDSILGKVDVIIICPTLGTNLLSTSLIAWKAWQRRITVRKHLCEGSGFVRLDRVFALLIESGIIYCCIWILYAISTFGVMPAPGFTIIVFVSALYPTLIIILVSMQMSPVEHYSTHSAEMQFARVPALGPPRDGSAPRHVLSIHREYTSDFGTYGISEEL